MLCVSVITVHMYTDDFGKQLVHIIIIIKNTSLSILLVQSYMYAPFLENC